MKPESWNSRFGAILAVAGSAVGLGNFLKFPGQVAMYGGASFMLAYVVSFFLLGLPIAVCEWTMGRHGGANGYHSPAGIIGFSAEAKNGLLRNSRGAAHDDHFLLLCLHRGMVPRIRRQLPLRLARLQNLGESGGFFADFVGAGGNGSSLKFGLGGVLVYFLFSFSLNFVLIYRGVSKGIELFCKYAMPTLIVIAIVIVARMMTLSDVTPEHPERTINQGLGFMWNPVKVVLEEDRGGKWVEAQRLVGDIEMRAAEEKVAGGGGKVRIRRISVWSSSQTRRFGLLRRVRYFSA